MDLYSVTLLGAFIAAGGAILGALAPKRGRALRRTTAACLGLALALGVFSLAYHWCTGHDAGSAEPMGAARFFIVHPAYLVLAAMSAAAGVVIALRRGA